MSTLALIFLHQKKFKPKSKYKNFEQNFSIKKSRLKVGEIDNYTIKRK